MTLIDLYDTCRVVKLTSISIQDTEIFLSQLYWMIHIPKDLDKRNSYVSQSKFLFVKVFLLIQPRNGSN